jgi:C4-dicarboxylate transporter
MESRKKNIAAVAITALVAMKPTSRTELVVAGCIFGIAIVAILCQTYLDRKEKKDVKENVNSDVPAGTAIAD